MKKFEGLLFCTDLDGTLYSTDKTVSKKNLDAIEYFKSEGGLFTFITGRVPAISKEICDIIKPNAPYGCNNGGGIYDPQKDRYIWNTYMPNDVIELIKIVDCQLPEMGIQTNTEKNIYFNKDNSAMVYFRAVTGLPNITCPIEDLKEPLLKVIFAHEDENQISELINLLNNHPNANNFDFIRPERLLYEILPKGASKGSLLLKMAELLNIDAKRTIAVGDYNNDISMVKTARLGFAVSNAIDDLKAVADYTTVSNDEDAISVIIDGLDKGIYTL